MNPKCHHHFTAQWSCYSPPQDGVGGINILNSCTCAWLLPTQSLLDLGLLSPPACMGNNSRRELKGALQFFRSCGLLGRPGVVAVVSITVCMHDGKESRSVRGCPGWYSSALTCPVALAAAAASSRECCKIMSDNALPTKACISGVSLVFEPGAARHATEPPRPACST